MLEYSCTQCGGRVEVQEGEHIGRCPVCGSLFVLPNGFSQKKNLYQIALQARMAGNFQAALRDYGKILKIDAMETEAHWGYLLSKFGITVTLEQEIYFSRLEFSSFTADPSYQKMIEYCPREALYYYQGLSRQIEEKHRKLLEIAQKAGQYDIFINCTAAPGTADYILANRAGKALDDGGYRVFLPATMLSGVPAEERNLYEIAVAENSRAMLVPATPGTDYGDRRFGINWRRFLELRKNDAGRKLLSLYQNIRPDKELPLELQPFQAYACNQAGFEEMLVAEVDKMFGRLGRDAQVNKAVLEKLGQAESACSRGRFGEARKLYQEVIRLDAQEGAAHWGMVVALTENLLKPQLSEELEIHFANALKYAPDPGMAQNYQTRMAALMSDPAWQKLQEVTSHFEDREAGEEVRKAIERVYLYFLKSDSRLPQIDAYRRSCQMWEELQDLKNAYETADTATEPLFARLQEAADKHLAARSTTGFFAKNRKLFYLLIFGSLVLVLLANLLMMQHFEYERGYKGIHARIAFLVLDAGLMCLGGWLNGIVTGSGNNGKVSVGGFVLFGPVLIGISKLGTRRWVRQTFLVVLLIPALLFVIQRVYISRWLLGRRREVAREGREIQKIGEIREKIRKNYEEKAAGLINRYGLEQVPVVDFTPDPDSDAERILRAGHRKEKLSSGFLYGVNTVLILLVFAYGILFAFNQFYAARWKDITQLAAEAYHLVGLKADGTVVTAGYNMHGQREVKDWKDIVQVEAGEEFTAGLASDGTVRIAAQKDSPYQEAEAWTDIVSISAARRHLVGLKADGTCVAAGPNETGECEVGDFKDIVELHAADGPGGQFTYGLASNGRVYCTGYTYMDRTLADFFARDTGPEEGKRKIERIYGDYWAIVAIDDQGGIYAAGSDNNHQLSSVLDWDGRELTKIYVSNFTVGLRKDGTCVSGGNVASAKAAVRSWSHVTDLAGSDRHVVALCEDGTVCAAGENENGQCNVYDWEQITSITASRYNSFGIREDGGVEAAGYNTCGLTYTRPKSAPELIQYLVEYVTTW